MKTRSALLPREKLLRDTFTPAESFIYRLVLIVCGFAFCFAGPRYGWALGGFLIAAPLCPIILKIHQSSHPFRVDLLWPRFWLITAPIWLLLLQLLLGLMQSPLQTVEIDSVAQLSLGPVNPWIPLTTGGITHTLPLLSFGALYLVAANLFLIPKSHYFFERLLRLLCYWATLLAVFGYIQKALQLNAPLFTSGTAAGDFFAFFPYEGHWAAFALLWCTANGAIILLSIRNNKSQNLLKSRDRRYLLGTLLLGGSGFCIDAHWPAVLLLLTYAALLIQIGRAFLNESQDRHRKKIATFTLSIAVLALCVSCLRILRHDVQPPDSAPQLRQAAQSMFHESPVFGWGTESYQQLIPFFIDDLSSPSRYQSAQSDWLQGAAEFGIFGLLLALLTLSLLLLRYLKGRSDIKLTNQLLLGCSGLLLLAAVDNPFMSPAVFVSFWILFFSALRWADLTRNHVDEVDAATAPTFVTPASLRNAPFIRQS